MLSPTLPTVSAAAFGSCSEPRPLIPSTWSSRFLQGRKESLPRQSTGLSTLRPRKHGFPLLENSGFRQLQVKNMTSESWWNDRQHWLDLALDSTRKVFDRLPEPAKSFPWTRAVACFFRFIFELVVAVSKYLCVPMLAISSLSEMSYCAHERKMTFIPVPFLAGIALAVVLEHTAVKLSPDLKAEDFPWHLLLMAFFFVLLKLPGPHYPYVGRLIVPHFANGGLWTTLWFAFKRYRVPRDLGI